MLVFCLHVNHTVNVHQRQISLGLHVFLASHSHCVRASCLHCFETALQCEFALECMMMMRTEVGISAMCCLQRSDTVADRVITQLLGIIKEFNSGQGNVR